jgi:integrase
MILQTGMRPEEVYRVEPKNVHLKGGYLENLTGKTKAAKRRITLTSVARGILARRIADSDGPYLFLHDTDSSRPTPKVIPTHEKGCEDFVEANSYRLAQGSFYVDVMPGSQIKVQ